MNKLKSLSLIVMILLLSGFVLADLTTSDILYYTLDDAEYSAPTITDVTLTGNDGTAVNSPTSGVTGRVNEAFDFDGINDYISLPNGLLTTSDSFSISWWQELDTTAGTRAIWRLDNDLYLQTFLNEGAFGTGLCVGGYSGSSWAGVCDATPPTIWTHYVYTYDDSTGDMILYKNGVSEDTNTGVIATGGSPSLNRLADGSNDLDGVVDEFSIWTRVLTPTEVGELYNGGSGLQYPFNVNNFLNITSQTYGDNQLLVFNATINGTDYQTTNGTISTDINGTGAIPITIFTEFFNITYVDWSAPNDLIFNYSVLNISVQNIRNNVTIDPFNITLEDFGKTIDSNNSVVLLYLNDSQNSPLNVTVRSPLIATTNEGISFNGTNVSNHIIYVYAANSININVYDTATSNLIDNQTVTAQFSLGGNLTSYNTTNGTLFVYNLTAGNYTITFTSSGYSSTSYSATVTDFSTQNLNAYLSPESATNTVFAFKNIENDAAIENITLTIEQIIGDEWTIVSIKTSDITGRVLFNYDAGIKYRFTATGLGWVTKTFTLDPIIFTSYNIFLEKEIEEVPDQDFNRVTITYSPNIYYSDYNNSILFSFVSASGEFETYGFNASYKTASVADSGTNLYGENLNQTLEILNASFGDKVILTYYYSLSNGTTKTFTIPYTIVIAKIDGTHFANKGETYGLGLFERVLITTLIVVGVGGAAFLFGGILSAGLMTMLIFGYITYIGFLSGWLTIPSMIIIFIVTSWGATR